MKTGIYKQIKEKKNNGYISISLYSSKNEFVKHEYKSLAPNWKLYEDLKSKKISEEKFILNYNEQLDTLNPRMVFEDLNSLVSGYEPILMTDGSKKKFCHRHLVAEWLEKNLDVIIEEYKIGRVLRKNGTMKKFENPTLF